MRVLVTGVGGPAGRSLASQLRALGHWVGGTDLLACPHSAVDGFRRVRRATDPAYPDELAELAVRWGVDAVIPTVSEELVPLSRVRDGFPALLLVGGEAAVRIADDKHATAQTLRSRGVSVPRSLLPSAVGGPAEAVDRLGGSALVKPRVSRGGRGVRVIDRDDAGRPEQLEAWRRLDDTMIVQRFAPGVEYAPVVYAPLSDRARPVCAVLRKRSLREGRTGNAVSVERVDGPGVADVRELAQAAVDALGLAGPVDVDIRRRADGTPVVLEVNARFGANSAQAPDLLQAALLDLGALRSRR